MSNNNVSKNIKAERIELQVLQICRVLSPRVKVTFIVLVRGWHIKVGPGIVTFCIFVYTIKEMLTHFDFRAFFKAFERK